MFTRRWVFQTVAFAVLAAVLGCSRGRGDLATVSGTVSHNGVPVEGAKVTFHSTVEVEGKGGMAFSALTDSSGKYLLATGVNKEPGILPGMYKVTITKLKGAAAATAGMDQGQLEAAGGGGGGALNDLPDVYAKKDTSKLSVTLETGKNENKNFELKGQASATRPAGVP
jgi:hypothetical protein